MALSGKTLATFAVPAALVVAAIGCMIAAAAGAGGVYAWSAVALLILAFWTGLVLSLALGLRARNRLTARLSPAHSTAQLEAADREGLLAPARVLSIAETGVGQLHSVVCEIAVVIAPAKGKPYQARVTRLVSPIEAPRLQPDQMVCVLEAAPDAVGPDAAPQLVLDPPSSWKPSSSRKRIAREAPAASSTESSAG